MCCMPAVFLLPNIDANNYVLSSFLCQALLGTLTMYPVVCKTNLDSKNYLSHLKVRIVGLKKAE